ncbi:MAG: ATP-binding protein [Chloroflexota bacterium]|nr:ATP-binding protein [Chloroflexota bacterium]
MTAQAGQLLAVTGVVALVFTLRRVRVLESRDAAIALSTLMLTALMQTIWVIFSSQAPAGQSTELMLIAVPTLLLTVGLMLLRVNTTQDAELRTTSQMWSAMLDTTQDAVIMLDADLVVTTLNATAVKLFGVPWGNLAGRRLEDLFPGASLSWSALLEERQTHVGPDSVPITPEIMLITPGGEERWLTVSPSPLSGPNGKHGTVLLLHDLTHVKDYERRRAEIEARGEMLAILSHELRTPLTLICGYADLLHKARHTFTPRQGEQVDRIAREGTRVVAFLDNVLQARAIEVQSAKCEEVDLAPFLEGIAGRFRLGAPTHDIRWDLACEPLRVNIDAALVEHAVDNLLANATKYSPAGSRVHLRLERVNGEASVSVTDEGRGIPADDVERIFEPAYRAGNTAGIAGFGWGLYLARQVVEGHGGRICADPTDGGARLRFTLPLMTAPKQESLAERSPANATA